MNLSAAVTGDVRTLDELYATLQPTLGDGWLEPS